MNEVAHATQAHALIAIIAALIPLVIWAFRNAEETISGARAEILRRFDHKE